jgi:hypothetical protein
VIRTFISQQHDFLTQDDYARAAGQQQYNQQVAGLLAQFEMAEKTIKADLDLLLVYMLSHSRGHTIAVYYKNSESHRTGAHSTQTD